VRAPISEEQCAEILTMARCYALRMGVMPGDLDDVSQETFLIAFKNGWADLNVPDARRTHVVKWAAHNAVRNLLGTPRLTRFRLRAASRALVDNENDNAFACTDPRTEPIEVVGRILRSVNRRSGMMLLARMQEMTFQEIGDMFDVSRQCVHQIVQRIRAACVLESQSR